MRPGAAAGPHHAGAGEAAADDGRGAVRSNGHPGGGALHLPPAGPGQATSYFYGFTRLNELRAEVEQAMGKRFDAQRFHDFVLAQGLLPPDLLRQAVFADFVRGPLPTQGTMAK
nr:DUF885 family protein [Pyxidicoccus trucidator]